MSFDDSLRFGQAAESNIALWLRGQGFCVLPVYEKLLDDKQGPRLFLARTSVIAPDLFVFRGETVMWIEAKHKAAFTWHRITRRWVTGIDLRHYEEYCRVADETPWPVWVLFLQRGGKAVDHPGWIPASPSGLFGANIGALRKAENHRHGNWGTSGMVYWTTEEYGGPLKKLAEFDDVLAARTAA